MKYKIVNEFSAGILEESVDKLLEEGWLLRGDLIVKAESEHQKAWFYQVMILDENEKQKRRRS